MSWREKHPAWPFYASARGFPRANGWRRRVDTPAALEALRSAPMDAETRAALAVRAADSRIVVTCYQTMAGAVANAFHEARPLQVFSLETR
jgi:hypothetical protein